MFNILKIIATLCLITNTLYSKGKKLSSSTVNQNIQTVKILSIDGGGIRGIIPTIILQNIIKRTKKHNDIAKYFNVMAGTSTGALICLMLNVKDNERDLKYNLKDVERLYETLGKEVFSRSWYQYITSMGGMISAKYDNTSLKKHLNHYLNGEKLSSTYTNVLIPAYNLKKRRMTFFRTSQAKLFPQKNYLLKHIAQATSAAPTYFEAATFTNILGSWEGVYIDGGIGINNPAISAAVYGMELYGRDKPIFLLSIGCGCNYYSSDDNIKLLNINPNSMGQLDWLSKIIDVVFESVSDVTHYQAYTALPTKYYYRINVTVPLELMAMDNGSEENVQKLKEYAYRFCLDNEKLIKEIANKLDQLSE